MTENLHHIKPIVLVGPMGCGKSTVGKVLAQLLQRDFLDLDDKIVRDNGMTIPEIFAQFSEEGFRLRETQALRAALADCSCVIASGGGIASREENRALLKEQARCVYLYCPVETQYQRTLNDRNRPMIQAADPKKRLTELFAVRDPQYREVSMVAVDSSRLNPEECAAEICRLLQQREQA